MGATRSALVWMLFGVSVIVWTTVGSGRATDPLSLLVILVGLGHVVVGVTVVLRPGSTRLEEWFSMGEEPRALRLILVAVSVLLLLATAWTLL